MHAAGIVCYLLTMGKPRLCLQIGGQFNPKSYFEGLLVKTTPSTSILTKGPKETKLEAKDSVLRLY